MKIIYKFTKLDSTLALREYAEKKISSLEKYLPVKSVSSARIEFEKVTEHHRKGDIYRCEVNLQINGDLIRVEATEEDIRAAVDKMGTKLRQILSKRKDQE